MKNLILIASVLLLCAGPPSLRAGDDESTISRLDWLAGEWAGPFQDGKWEAIYTTPTGGEILSVNKEFAQDRVKMFEFERFYEKDDRVRLVPYPGGRQSVEFLLTSFDPEVKRARFVNAEHDFPTEIIYELKSADNLLIGVYAERDGKKVGFELDLKRRP